MFVLRSPLCRIWLTCGRVFVSRGTGAVRAHPCRDGRAALAVVPQSPFRRRIWRREDWAGEHRVIGDAGVRVKQHLMNQGELVVLLVEETRRKHDGAGSAKKSSRC